MNGAFSNGRIGFWRMMWLRRQARRGYRVFVNQADRVGWMTVLGRGERLESFCADLTEHGWEELEV